MQVATALFPPATETRLTDVAEQVGVSEDPVGGVIVKPTVPIGVGEPEASVIAVPLLLNVAVMLIGEPTPGVARLAKASLNPTGNAPTVSVMPDWPEFGM